jgi:uncharacterized protein YaeQ
MALNGTVHSMAVALDDADRGVHRLLEFRIVRHPSETAEYLMTRVLAYCLEFGDGLAFSKGGLSDPDAPALSIRELTGVLKAWIEVGLPDPARLHRAAKAAPRVAVYAHREIAGWVARLSAEAVHRAAEIEIYTLDPQVLAALVNRLERRMRFGLVISDRQLYLTIGEETVSGAVSSHRAA